MSGNEKNAGGREEPAVREEPAASGTPDAELELALKSFRQSVHAWGDAEMSRPRTVAGPVRRLNWRMASGWALGCVLAAGGVSGGLVERHHLAVVAQAKAAQEAEHQRQLAAEREREEEELLARVDSDISRDVPSAMEPLAQLMAEDESK
jgi:hypothetical protein